MYYQMFFYFPYLEFFLESFDVLSSGKNFRSSFLLFRLLCLGLRCISN